MQSPPTDFELLGAIYKQHQKEYAAFVEGSRESPGFVPVDIDAARGHRTHVSVARSGQQCRE
jgi:hypothetical protein